MAPAVFVWNEKEWVCDAIKIHKSNGGFSLAYSDGKTTEAKKLYLSHNSDMLFCNSEFISQDFD